MKGSLDSYIWKTVAGSYLACLAFLLFLFIVFDLLINMGGYVRSADNLGIPFMTMIGRWARFHVVSSPWVFVTVAPFVTVIASMFSLSRFMRSNEIVPMIFTGRSMFRILTPVVVTGILSALAMAAVWEFAMPTVGRSMDRLRESMGDQEIEEVDARSVVLRSPTDPRRVLMCERYDHSRLRMEGVVLWDRGVMEEDIVSVTALAADWDPEKGDWELHLGKERSGDIERDRAMLGMGEATPEIIRRYGKEGRDISLLSYSDLSGMIEMSPNRPMFTIAFHYHFTYPLANLILLLLALPLATSFERSNKIGRVIIAILICGGYLAIDLAFQNLGRHEYLHPIVAAWASTIFFGSLGLVMFATMRS